MKWCPQCQLIYEDESLNFCRADGTGLWSTSDLTQDLLPKKAESDEITRPLTDSLSMHSISTRALDEAPTTSNLSILPAPPTQIIGRETEISELKNLLQEKSARLITLTGPGGTGKTRLALQAGIELMDYFADGVSFVPLAAVRDPDRLGSAIAQTLGVKEPAGVSVFDKLEERLSSRETLLILDNFEQIISAAPFISELLSACPGLKILVTSREVLHLRGEREFAVLPLALPCATQMSVDSLLDYSSVALFVERAQAARADFSLTEKDAQAVAGICERLDGLPLAIELAAARIKLLSPDALLARLENRLHILKGGQRDLPARQQTMRDTIDWSYELLEEKEKMLFRRLSIFVGGFTLESAEAVCFADGEHDLDLLSGVASLLDKSLIVRSELSDGESRFSMLETIRDYGLEALDSSGEIAELRSRHADHYLNLAEQADPELWGAKGAEVFKLLETELDNLRGALRWNHSQNNEETLRLAGALARFWWIRGYFSEGGDWLGKALSGSAQIHTSARVKALLAASYLNYFQGDMPRSRSLAEDALTLSRGIKDDTNISQSLNAVGRHSLDDRDYNRALEMFEEGLALARKAGDRTMTAISLNNLGELARIRGEHDWARNLYEESLAVHRALGIEGAVATNLANLGHTALAQEDREAATRFYVESLKMSYRLGDRRVVCLGLVGLAGAYWAEHEPDRAARLLGAAEAEREAINYQIEQGDRIMYDQVMERVRSALGAGDFETIWSQGRRMRPGQAVIYALEDISDS